MASGARVCRKCLCLFTGRRCEVCHRADSRARYYVQRDAINTQLRQQYAENKDGFRDTRLRYKHAYYQKNKESCLAATRRYQQQHPEQTKLYRAKARGKMSKVVISSYWHERRARLLGASGTHTAQEWQLVLDVFDWHCAYCFVRMQRATKDHVIPISNGGSNSIDNIVPACGRCNSSKGTKVLEDWLWPQ